MTMDEYIQHQAEREQREGRHGSHGATNGHKLGHLAENFVASELHHEEHHVTAASTRRLADSLHVRAEGEQKPVSGNGTHLANDFKEGADKRPHKFARHVSNIGQVAKTAAQQHLADAINPGRPKTHEERIREREQHARNIEAKLHGATLKVTGRTVRALASGARLKDLMGNPPDNPPPSAPPAAPQADGSGPADAADSDKQRKIMTTPDGQQTQTVVTDKRGREIAVESPLIARPRRDEAEISTPCLSEGFNVPAQDVPASSATEQPSQPISVAQPERVSEAEQPGQSTLSTYFTTDPQNAGSPTEPGQGLSPEKPASDKAENGANSEAFTRPVEPSEPQNGTDVQRAPQNAPEPNSEAVAPTTEHSSRPAQTSPFPPNVTRLRDEREHRAELEGRQREQRSQRGRTTATGAAKSCQSQRTESTPAALTWA